MGRRTRRQRTEAAEEAEKPVGPRRSHDSESVIHSELLKELTREQKRRLWDLQDAIVDSRYTEASFARYAELIAEYKRGGYDVRAFEEKVLYRWRQGQDRPL